jgi:hypothetical protein
MCCYINYVQYVLPVQWFVLARGKQKQRRERAHAFGPACVGDTMQCLSPIGLCQQVHCFAHVLEIITVQII